MDRSTRAPRRVALVRSLMNLTPRSDVPGTGSHWTAHVETTPACEVIVGLELWRALQRLLLRPILIVEQNIPEALARADRALAKPCDVDRREHARVEQVAVLACFVERREVPVLVASRLHHVLDDVLQRLAYGCGDGLRCAGLRISKGTLDVRRVHDFGAEALFRERRPPPLAP